MGLTKPRAAQIFNLDYKQSTRVVTTTNITLSGGAPSLVDGVTLSLGDRVLVIAQSTATQNGLYYVTTVGSGANGTWARTSDGNENGEIEAGMIVMVTEGVIYADTQWKLITDDPIIINTTALTFTQNYMANSISSGTSNVVVNSNANVTISSAGTANVLLISSTGTVTSGDASVTGNITGSYIIGNGSQLTGLPASYSNTNVSTFLAAFGSNTISTTGTITGGNITGGNISATNHTGTTVSITGTVTAASTVAGVITGTSTSVTGTTTAASVVGGVITGSSASVTGNVTGGNIIGTIIATLFSTAGNITGGNLLTGGLISATGNITGGNISATLYSGTNVSVTGTQTAASTVGGVITGSSVSVTGTQTAASTVGGVITGSSTSVTGTTTAASIVGGVITGTSVSASGNVTGANLNTTGTATIGGLTISGNTIVSSGSTLTIDPNASGGVDGLVVIAGNLQVTGNTTTINSNVVSTNDLTFNFANNAVNSSAANGAGIEAGPIGSPYLTFLYNSTSNVWTSSGGLSAVGQVTAASVAGGVITGSSTSVTGAQTAASTVGGVITGSSSSVTGTVTAASTVGGVITGSSTSVTGTQTAASTVGGVITGTSVSVTGAVTGASVVGGVITGSSTSVTGAVSGASVVGGVITGSSVSVTGNVTGAYFIGNGSALTGIASSGGSSITNGTSNVVVAASGNVTVGVAGTAAVSTFATTGEYVSGLISATGNITGGNLIQGGVRVIKWTTVANTAPTSAVPGDFWYNSYTGIKYQYTNDGTSNVWVDQSYPTSFSTLAVTGNTTSGNLSVSTGTVTAGNIVNANGSGSGNIGSATTYFNTVFAKATSAQYADLAEMYSADEKYCPGTVVEFGGSKEVTVSTQSHSTRVAGIISTNPSYLMNSSIECENAVAVALTGRVPCQVVGTIRKGDRLVASNLPGVATVLDMKHHEPGCIIGKALEDYDSIATGIIEVAVGRY
jgi:hypothetical protein